MQNRRRLHTDAEPVLNHEANACHHMLRRCELTEDGEEGLTAMDQSHVQMDSCHIHSNKGPALDISGHATVSATNCSLHDNAGNGWLHPGTLVHGYC